MLPNIADSHRSKLPISGIESLTFHEWWHLIARYTSTIESRDSVRTALRIMAHRGFRHLPVVQDGSLFGIVSAGDLIDLFVASRGSDVQSNSVPMAGARESANRILESLNLPISHVANAKAVSVRADDTIMDAIRLMSQKNTGSLLIVDGTGKLLGIVTLRDIVSILAAYAPFNIKVEDYMSPEVKTVQQSDPIHSAMTLMSSEKVRRLPVTSATRNKVSGEAFVGIITNKMILRYLESIISFEMMDVRAAINQQVKSVMYSSMPTIDPREDCGNAAYMMRELGTGGFAVLDSRELVGIITERDLVKRIFENEGEFFFSELFRKGNARMEA